MKRNQSMISLVCATVMFLVMVPAAVGQVPGIMTYQGVLYDSEGRPLDGTYDISAKLYPVAQGGSPEWTETHTGTLVRKGVFVLMLGRQAPLTSALLNQPLYLGVSVNAGAEMTPRVELASVGTALLAKEMAPQSITADMVAPGQIITSIRGENGGIARGDINIRGEGSLIVEVIDNEIVFRNSQCDWVGWADWPPEPELPYCGHCLTRESYPVTQTRRECTDQRITDTQTREVTGWKCVPVTWDCS